MKKLVCKFLPMEPYDMRGLEEWLSAMAARGLHLVKIGESFARFEPGPAREGVRYALDVKDWADIDQERNELYAQAGWEYVTTFKRLYFVYRTADPDAPALHTDPVTQSFTFDRLLRRRLWALILLIPLTLFMFRNELSALIDNPWSPVYLFFLKTEGCLLYLALLVLYVANLVPLFRQRRALKKLQKRLADGIPLEEIHFRRRRVPWAVASWSPVVLMVCALALFIWNNPNAKQDLPDPEDWTFPHMTLEQVMEQTDVVNLIPENPYDAMLHPPTRRRSLLVPEQINIQQYGTARLEDGSAEECGIYLHLYRLRCPDTAPLLLRCIQEEELAWWRRYEKNTGEFYINSPLEEFSGFQRADHPTFDELTALTWRTEDMEECGKLYIGRAGDLVFTLSCSGPADIEHALELFAKEAAK